MKNSSRMFLVTYFKVISGILDTQNLPRECTPTIRIRLFCSRELSKQKLMNLWLLFCREETSNYVYCQNEILNDTYNTNISKAANHL